MRTKDEDEGRKKSGKKKGTVPVSIEREVSIERKAVVFIEREAFAETMVDVSDRRKPCSPSLRGSSW